MENLKLSERKNRNRTLLIGAGLVALLIAPIVGSASLEGGGFFIYAYNDQEPEINARAGLNGLASNPGGENPGNNLASTVTCGDQSVTVTQAMLDFSDKNRKAIASGGSAEIWPGGDWKFITVGSYWEAIWATPIPAGFEPKKDRAYIFSSDPSGGSFPQIASLQEIPFLGDRLTGDPVNDIDLPSFSDSTGTKPSVIGEFALSDGSNTYTSCSYSKMKSGKLSSSDGSPAYYAEETDGSRRTLYAENGLPAFGTERASYTIRYSADIVIDAFYHRSNGEEWDYSEAKNSIWHPDRQIERSEVTGEKLREIRWTNCFGDSCDVKIETPTVKVEETKLNQGEVVLMNNYIAPQIINGANAIMVKYRANGTLKSVEYSDSNLSGAASENGQPRWSFSRTDGPALYSEDETGKMFHSEYYVDGYAMASQAEYETAGGKQWQGIYQEGMLRE